MWLVINDAPYTMYKDKFKLFTDKDKAMGHAKSIGWENTFNMTLSDEVGMLNNCKHGDVDASIIRIEISE